MPKSAHMANAPRQGRARGARSWPSSQRPRSMRSPMLTNTCYSFVSDSEAIHVASVHELSAAETDFQVRCRARAGVVGAFGDGGRVRARPGGQHLRPGYAWSIRRAVPSDWLPACGGGNRPVNLGVSKRWRRSTSTAASASSTPSPTRPAVGPARAARSTGTKYGCGVAQCGACTVHHRRRADAVVRASRLLGDAEPEGPDSSRGLSPTGVHALQKAWQRSTPQCAAAERRCRWRGGAAGGQACADAVPTSTRR